MSKNDSVLIDYTEDNQISHIFHDANHPALASEIHDLQTAMDLSFETGVPLADSFADHWILTNVKTRATTKPDFAKLVNFDVKKPNSTQATDAYLSKQEETMFDGPATP